MPETLQLVVGLEGSPARLELEAVVREVYAATYGARITHLLPLLLGLADGTGHPGGVVGAQFGTDSQPMFLEEYLERPVQEALSAGLGRHVPRRALAEVGNLSALRPGLGRPLVSTMAAYLEGAGVGWAVFTATRALRLAFRHMGLQLVDLGAAEGARLGGRLSDWGTYYDTEPRVTAVSVPEMRAAAARDARLSANCLAAWTKAHCRGCRRGLMAA